MQTTESEVELVMKIDTGKYRAVCASVGLSADASADAVMDAVLDNMNVFRRSLFMVLSRMPQKWIDDVADLLIARQSKKPSRQNQNDVK